MFIAEVSSNHHQDLERCLQFVDCAAQVGCSSAKFQLFKIDELFTADVLATRPGHRERRKWELPVSFLKPLADRSHELGIQFSATPFYLKAVEELEPYVDFYKVASYELLWSDLLAECARTGKPVILSTGMATMNEIAVAVEVLRGNGCKDLTLLHCTSSYPTPPAECNLAAIQTMRDTFGCQVGWSDHTVNPGVISRAIHRWGATAVEFHLDLDGKGAEYAAGHCWLPEQIKAVIRDTKDAFIADGSGVKEPAAIELVERDWRADPSDGLRPTVKIRGLV
ncbi:N-acetylneuraminate synthase [Prosthecobacter debontii]|uniref:N-acetylneuraminate synthase n=1 Tax=Prosthecobacter debontii TaxID=48467 RepID=A0A1T4XTF4_9BACT|nr:N-acetylneuraminate synthase family protein [Prosthecobacter debontii]SKA92836.1 N-acetylneuraminate synthase [Prosthecobacter debontii]